jgi:hypothetical protein
VPAAIPVAAPPVSTPVPDEEPPEVASDRVVLHAEKAYDEWRRIARDYDTLRELEASRALSDDERAAMDRMRVEEQEWWATYVILREREGYDF